MDRLREQQRVKEDNVGELFSAASGRVPMTFK